VQSFRSLYYETSLRLIFRVVPPLKNPDHDPVAAIQNVQIVAEYRSQADFTG